MFTWEKLCRMLCVPIYIWCPAHAGEERVNPNDPSEHLLLHSHEPTTKLGKSLRMSLVTLSLSCHCYKDKPYVKKAHHSMGPMWKNLFSLFSDFSWIVKVTTSAMGSNTDDNNNNINAELTVWKWRMKMVLSSTDLIMFELDVWMMDRRCPVGNMLCCHNAMCPNNRLSLASYSRQSWLYTASNYIVIVGDTWVKWGACSTWELWGFNVCQSVLVSTNEFRVEWRIERPMEAEVIKTALLKIHKK